MKKLLHIIMLGILLFFVWIAEQEVSNNQIIQIGDMDETYAVSFSIPSNTAAIAPDNLFSALLDVTESTGSNIFRTVLTDGENGGYELVKYALLSGDSAYMSVFEIEKGRYLSTEDTRADSDVYISTKDTDNSEQIGIIGSNMINLNVTVYPLYQQFSYYKADGNYYVELGDGVTIDDFLNALAASIETHCGLILSVTDFEGTGSSIGVPYTDTFIYYLLLSGIVLIFFFILIYCAIRDTKRICVMKLFGTDGIQMLRHFIAAFILEIVVLIAMIAVGLILQGYHAEHLMFILKKSSLFAGVLLICLAMVYSFVVNHVNIASGLKGDQKGRVIYFLNTMAKIICMCAVIYCGQSVYRSVCESVTLLSQLNAWDDAGNYGVFYPYYIGYESSESEELERDLAINENLYPYLNALGALYVDVNYFDDTFRQLNSDCEEWSFYATVNTNYLKKYDLFDLSGNLVSIDESESDWIMLVPEKYGDYEVEIAAYYKEMIASGIEYAKTVYHADTSKYENLGVKIIWIANNQKIFGYCPSIGTDQNGWIQDAVILVLTEGNASILNCNCVLGNGTNDPLKIGITEDSATTYQSLLPILEELGLSDNFKAIVAIDEAMNAKLVELKAALRISLKAAFVGIAILLFFAIQNTILHFDRYRKKYIVKKIHGISMVGLYGQYYASSAMIYVFMSVIFIVLSGGADIAYYTLTGVGLIIVQTVASMICIRKIEQSRISDVLKGA